MQEAEVLTRTKVGLAGVNETEEDGCHGQGLRCGWRDFRGGCWKVPVVIMGVESGGHWIEAMGVDWLSLRWCGCGVDRGQWGLGSLSEYMWGRGWVVARSKQ